MRVLVMLFGLVSLATTPVQAQERLYNFEIFDAEGKVWLLERTTGCLWVKDGDNFVYVRVGETNESFYADRQRITRKAFFCKRLLNEMSIPDG